MVSQATTSWVVLEGSDIAALLSSLVVKKLNENIGDTVDPNDPLNMDLDNRRNMLLDMAVAEVRGAIQSAGRFPLSVTQGAVPHTAVPHALYLAAYRMINSTPGVEMVVIDGQPAAKKFFDDACIYIQRLIKGGSVEEPSDPTGVDYLTAVSDINAKVCLVRYGDLNADDTDYANGYITTSSGSTLALPVDDMRTY